MDKEFLFLAIVCLATLAFVVVLVVDAIGFPAEQESDVWSVCEQPLGNEQVRDCELRQMIEDINASGG